MKGGEGPENTEGGVGVKEAKGKSGSAVCGERDGMKKGVECCRGDAVCVRAGGGDESARYVAYVQLLSW